MAGIQFQPPEKFNFKQPDEWPRWRNAPINVMPHYPPPGPYRGKGGAFDLF